jgi:Domain of unknown function (DUF4145)
MSDSNRIFYFFYLVYNQHSFETIILRNTSLQPSYIKPHPNCDLFTCSHCKQISTHQRFVLQSLKESDPAECLSKSSCEDFVFQFCKNSSPVTFGESSIYDGDYSDISDCRNPLLNRLVALQCNSCKRLHLFTDNSPAQDLEFQIKCIEGGKSFNTIYDERTPPTYTLLYPTPLEAPLPSEDMPEAIQKIYNEARILLPHSPSASCAFLRKALETLLYDYTKIEYLQQSIDKFFKEHHGMRESLDQHFQALKLYGNEAIHIREINESDNKEDALILFECLNHIVKTLTTLPKETNNLKLMQKEAKK